VSPGPLRLRILLALALLLFAAQAQAQDKPSQRQASFAWDSTQVLRMTVSYRDILDAVTEKNLAGGLPTTIVMRGYAFAEDGGNALAATFKSCRVVYDLWNEVYTIAITQSGSPDHEVASPTLEGVLRRCTEADRLPVAARAAFQGKKSIYLAAVVEVNPVSQDMLEKIRRWVSRPFGTATQAPGDALFGSFVGLFVTNIGAAERELRFRTQPVAL
jgi:hypothetical protein